MAQETLTRQSVNRSGAKLTLQSVTTSDGFRFPNDGHTLLYVHNGASQITLTFTIQKKLDGQSATRAVAVTASEDWIIGPFPTALYNDADDYVIVAISADLTNGISVVSV